MDACRCIACNDEIGSDRMARRGRHLLDRPGQADTLAGLQSEQGIAAEVAELADALDSGSSGLRAVGVQVPPSASTLPMVHHPGLRRPRSLVASVRSKNTASAGCSAGPSRPRSVPSASVYGVNLLRALHTSTGVVCTCVELRYAMIGRRRVLWSSPRCPELP